MQASTVDAGEASLERFLLLAVPCHPRVLIILFSAVAERRATFVHQGDVVGCDPRLEGST
jgi:hypothetical protein